MAATTMDEYYKHYKNKINSQKNSHMQFKHEKQTMYCWEIHATRVIKLDKIHNKQNNRILDIFRMKVK